MSRTYATLTATSWLLFTWPTGNAHESEYDDRLGRGPTETDERRGDVRRATHRRLRRSIDGMLEAKCHCGAVRIIVPSKPDYLIDCNCTICRRNGALWALYEADAVERIGHPENTTEYVWGPRTIRTMHCKICGCATHWEPLDSNAATQSGVNARNFEPADITEIAVRKFDGALTWSYIE